VLLSDWFFPPIVSSRCRIMGMVNGASKVPAQTNVIEALHQFVFCAESISFGVDGNGIVFVKRMGVPLPY
jgi:hypothetical protein